MTRLYIPEPKIDLYNDGFDEHDELGRKETGAKLSGLVERIDDPLVIALDGAWGTGKSVFLKCWVGEHLKHHGEQTQTVYFDAFKHDYLDDPLTALTGVLSERFNEIGEPKPALKKMKQAAAKLWRPGLRTGLALATAGASELAGPVIDAGLAAG